MIRADLRTWPLHGLRAPPPTLERADEGAGVLQHHPDAVVDVLHHLVVLADRLGTRATEASAQPTSSATGNAQSQAQRHISSGPL